MELAQLLYTALASAQGFCAMECFPFGGRQNWNGVGGEHHLAFQSTVITGMVLLRGCCGISILLPDTKRISRSRKQLPACSWMSVLQRPLGCSQCSDPRQLEHHGQPCPGEHLAHCRTFCHLCEASRRPCCPGGYSPQALAGQLTFQAPELC